MDPPARFLQRDPSTGLWNDVGNKRFREKVSQALREHQPFIKAVIDCEEDSQPGHPVARSHEGTKSQKDLESQLQSYAPAPSTNNLSGLLDTENRREVFLATRAEANSILCGGDDLDQAEERGMSLGDFSVSQGPSFSSINSYPPHERNSGCWETLFSMEEMSIPLAIKNGLDFPESSPFQRLSAQDSSLFGVADEGLGNQKIGWEESCLARLGGTPDLPRPAMTKRVLSNDGESPVKRCLLNRDKSEVARKLKETHSAEVLAGSFLSFSSDDPELETLMGALEKSFSFP